MTAALEIEIDKQACRGAGECALRAVRTFAVGDDDRSVVIDPRGDELDVVVAAARCCPHFAIRVVHRGKRLV